MDLTTVIVGVCGALFGGISKEIIDRLWIRVDKRIDAATQLREELWTEVRSLREIIVKQGDRISELENRSSEWRGRYFDLLARHNSSGLNYQLDYRKYEDWMIELEKPAARPLNKNGS